jgi:uncharacterized protein (DUF697 family)
MDPEKNSEIIDIPSQSEGIQPSECEIDALIRNRVYASLAVGFVPVPLADVGALTAIQVEMVYKLSKAYGLSFNKEWIRKAIAFILGGVAPVALAPNVGSLLRYVPLIGLGLGAASASLTFGAATYAVGHAFARRFARGQVISKEDLKEMGEEIKAGIEKGKKKVKGWVGGDKGAATEPEGASA